MIRILSQCQEGVFFMSKLSKELIRQIIADGEFSTPNDKLFCIEKMVANKCDLCSNSKEGPACIRVCPTSAFKIVTEKDLSQSIKNKRKSAIIKL